MTSEKVEPGNFGHGWIGAFSTIKPIPGVHRRRISVELPDGRFSL